MPQGELSPEELAAGEIVAQQCGGGTVIPRDIPGAPNRTHELDVTLPDGRRLAVEVTSARDSRLLSVYATAFGRTWEAPNLSHDWQIGVESEVPLQVPQLMADIEQHLQVLEEHGTTEAGRVSSTEWREAGAEVVEAVEEMHALEAILVRQWGAPGPGESAQLLLSGHGGAASDPELVNALVTERANAKVAKLAAAAGDERHLFVWIDPSYADAELAMATQLPPDSTPLLPSEIDVVWAATAGGHPEAPFSQLWRIQPPGRWEAR